MRRWLSDRAGIMDAVCGRYVSVKETARLVELFAAPLTGPELAPSYNVAPTSTVYGIVEHPDKDGHVQRATRDLRWGMVPAWTRDLKQLRSPLHNARVETLASKPSWRGPFRKKRLAVPAAGYYEWAPREHDSKVTKQPYYLHPAGNDPDGILAFAGLYDMWRDPSKADDDPDRWLWSCTIVTADASGPAGEIHDRTPLILPADRIDAWLDPARTDPDQVYQVLDGIVMPPLDVRPVSTRVNRVGPHGPDLIEPLDGHDEPLQLTLATRAA